MQNKTWNTMDREKLLVVDDDERLCRLLRRHLQNAGYETSVAHNDVDMHRCMESDQFNLVILDINLPGKDGLTMAQELRQRSDIPIIFLSANADISYKINGLQTGADDYITKPFETPELLARIQSVLRRSKAASAKPETASSARFAGWQINLIDQTLLSPDGQPVDITSYEFSVLSVLVNHANEPISREELLKLTSRRSWSPLDRSVDMAISKLRKKIEDSPKNPKLILTIRNKGYQLASTVEFEYPTRD